MIRLPWCLALPALCLQAWSGPYPALDTTSRWSIGSWGHSLTQGFYFSGVSKNVWNGPGQASSKTVFYNFSVQGVRMAGLSLPLAGLLYRGEMANAGYIVKFGSFGLDLGLSVTASVYFHDDCRLEVIADVSGPAGFNGVPYEIILRFDYDIGGSDNNVAEFLWNGSSEGGSLSPPQGPGSAASDGMLQFNASPDTGADYWGAVSHEITVAYPPLPSAASVERAAYARIFNAGSKFGMLFWGDPNSSTEATFKTYGGNTGNLNPRANINTEIQRVAEAPGWPRYGYAGSDQIMFIRLKGSFQNGISPRFTGKLFQRPNNRPLALNLRQHHADDLGGFTIHPDYPIRNIDGETRTLRTALQDLPGPENLKVGVDLPYLPYGGFAPPGGQITEAQLHNLMTMTRTYSDAELNNVNDWKLDLYLVNWTLEGNPDANSLMFDIGGANGNRIAREGAAVFWPSHGGSSENRRRQTLLDALHAAGRSFNLNPAWSNCPFVGYCWLDPNGCGGYSCSQTACDPAVSPGCYYQAHTCRAECTDGTVMSLVDYTRSTLRFGTLPTTANPVSSERDWYRLAPESWVKPGRFGVNPTKPASMPPFETR